MDSFFYICILIKNRKDIFTIKKEIMIYLFKVDEVFWNDKPKINDYLILKNTLWLRI